MNRLITLILFLLLSLSGWGQTYTTAMDHKGGQARLTILPDSTVKAVYQRPNGAYSEFTGKCSFSKSSYRIKDIMGFGIFPSGLGPIDNNDPDPHKGNDSTTLSIHAPFLFEKGDTVILTFCGDSLIPFALYDSLGNPNKIDLKAAWRCSAGQDYYNITFPMDSKLTGELISYKVHLGSYPEFRKQWDRTIYFFIKGDTIVMNYNNPFPAKKLLLER